MELSWFRKPGPDRPGTLNLCYNALDRQVIRGLGGAPALITAPGTRDFAELLEQVAGLAGALTGLAGVQPGQQVRINLDDPADALLAALACERLGALHGEVDAPAVLITSRDEDDPVARVRLLRGVEPLDTEKDPDRDLDWGSAVKAGRIHPAPCAEVGPDAAAYVWNDEVVRVRDAVGHDSPVGRILARLCAGQPVDVTRA